MALDKRLHIEFVKPRMENLIKSLDHDTYF